jgi:hypothetical protein
MDTYQGADKIEGTTPQNVKAALLNCVKLTDQPNPLECLLIVDDYLSHELFPNTPYSRQIALMEILTSIIKEQLIYHRNTMGIPCQLSDSTRQQAIAAIKQDVKTHNRQLIGWTWIYYRYVRVDLDITQRMFARQTQLNEQTIRRYQEAIFSSITEILIHKEAAARRSRIESPEALIKREFAKSEITIRLNPHTILEMLRADPSLLYAFMELFETIKMDESAVLGVESQLLHN